MSLLLDTHALLWYISGDEKLPEARKREIKNESIPCQVSIASLWEIGIKLSLKKLALDKSLDEIFIEIQNSSIEILQVQVEHIKKISTLPLHHRDPFDRLIVAQAQVENLTIITRDPAFSSYDVVVKWN